MVYSEDKMKITKKAIQFGGKNGSLVVIIPREIARAMDIVQGSLLEIDIANTGIVNPKRQKRKVE